MKQTTAIRNSVLLATVLGLSSGIASAAAITQVVNTGNIYTTTGLTGFATDGGDMDGMLGASDLDWAVPEDVIPAFLTIASMAFTFNIAHGLAFGIISYVLLYSLRGRIKELNWAMFLLTAILMIYLAFYL